MSQPRRLDQLLANLGYGSRREVRDLVERGNVEVRGQTCYEIDLRVDSADVTFRGQPLEAPEGLLAMLHKPLGYVCSHSDREGPTIYELLPGNWIKRNPAVTSVGRLDKETSGLLLVTDQGRLVQRFTSPKSDMRKIYEVTVDKPLEPRLIKIFAHGSLVLQGEDKPCLPAELMILDELHARLTLSEGRYHQVRRMFASQGWEVTALHRTHFGEYSLQNLEAGKWRLMSLPGAV
jgi:16S rRNA pseudouridine516 synthase